MTSIPMQTGQPYLHDIRLLLRYHSSSLRPIRTTSFTTLDSPQRNPRHPFKVLTLCCFCSGLRATAQSNTSRPISRWPLPLFWLSFPNWLTLADSRSQTHARCLWRPEVKAHVLMPRLNTSSSIYCMRWRFTIQTTFCCLTILLTPRLPFCFHRTGDLSKCIIPVPTWTQLFWPAH